MEGAIVGRPTLLATLAGRRDAQEILSGLGRTGYPLEDVSVYYRLGGTDQVIDAVTGQVAAGQSITQEEVTPKSLENAQTLVLMHPNAEQFRAVEQVLSGMEVVDIKYQGETEADPQPGGFERHDQ